MQRVFISSEIDAEGRLESTMLQRPIPTHGERHTYKAKPLSLWAMKLEA